MRGSTYVLLFSVAAVWISFALGEGSVVTFHTQQGCNATLLCNQPGNVTWLDSDTSQKIEGPRFQTTAFGSFSTLLITSVSNDDGGNVTCVGQERNITITIQVCYDITNPVQCKATIDNGDDCTSSYMRSSCKKSCGLCPEPNCTETVLPTIPATEKPPTMTLRTDSSSTVSSSSSSTQDTEKPQTMTMRTDSSSTVSSSTSSTQDTRKVADNRGPSLISAFQGFFALFCALFSVLAVIGQN